MNLLDKVIVGLAFLGAVSSCLLSTRHWQRCEKVDSRTFDYCIQDIRTMNTYNSYLLAAVIVFLGLSIQKAGMAIPFSALILILCSFLTACSAIFFIPIRKPEDNGNSDAVRRLWVYTLILSQWTVILAALGITNAVLSLLIR